jgi:hypothetical protein
VRCMYAVFESTGIVYAPCQVGNTVRVPGHGHGGTEYAGVRSARATPLMSLLLWTRRIASIVVAAALMEASDCVQPARDDAGGIQPDNDAHRYCANLNLDSTVY